MPKFDYWEDDFDGRPPHGADYHDGPHHEHPYDDYSHDHHHPHPPYDGRRHQPVDVGKVDTTKMHDRYDMHVPFHMPPWGFKFPKLEKAFVPGSTPQEQVAYLLNRVDTMIDYFNHYDDKVWGAYNAVVHSALGNEAYYREITREEGYLADGSTPYTVIHIPYLDRAERPIYLELGLAFNNTTNNGVKENVFEASQNRVADKLIPAFNIADGWEGKAMLKGAPIQSVYTEGKFTLAVTDNGFLKIYPNTVAYEQLNRDRIRNAMGVQGVLINNGAKTPEQYASNGGELLARVGIGMNYDTKERIIVIVNGNPTPPNNASATGATADMFADIFARYGCTVAVETANNGSAVAMDKGQMIYMPDTALTGTIPTVPSLNCYWYITKRRHYHNQYVKDVADLIQKVGQNKWRCEIALQSCDFLKGRVNELQRDLDAEVQNRIDADEQLQANIDAEEQARIDADEQLQDNIDAEAEARRQADAQLQDNIDAEATAREQGDNALDTRITNEVNTLNTRITEVVTQLNNAIDTERQARIDGDNALSTRITNEVATLNALIDAEEQARIAGDTALQNSLTQLRNDYTAFLTTYANDLAETRRLLTALRSDVSTIQGQIASLQSNLSAVNTSITAILATINTIEESFENIKTAFTTLQGDWHDYKDDVDAEIAQMEQDWATYQTTIMSEVETLVREIIAEEGGGITPEIMALIQNAQWKTETTEELFSGTVSVENPGLSEYYAVLAYEPMITADTLVVTFDGVEYVCEAVRATESDNVWYGGVSVIDGSVIFDFVEFPFIIENDVNNNENVIYVPSAGTHTISISTKSVVTTDTFKKAVNDIAGWKTEGTEQLFSETVTTVAGEFGNEVELSYAEPFTADTIKVTFDGVEYTCTKQADDVTYGAPYDSATGSFDFSEYPFVIRSTIDGNIIITQTAGTHTVSASVDTVTYTNKFIEAVESLSGAVEVENWYDADVCYIEFFPQSPFVTVSRLDVIDNAGSAPTLNITSFTFEDGIVGLLYRTEASEFDGELGNLYWTFSPANDYLELHPGYLNPGNTAFAFHGGVSFDHLSTTGQLGQVRYFKTSGVAKLVFGEIGGGDDQH